MAFIATLPTTFAPHLNQQNQARHKCQTNKSIVINELDGNL